MSSKRIARWSHAIKVARGQATPHIEDEWSPDLPSLEEWWDSAEGLTARELLKEAQTEILLGYSEAFMSRTQSVVLTADGCLSHSGIVGIAAAYTTEEPQREIITLREAVQCAIGYEFEEIDSEQSLIKFIRDKLNDIAREVNQKALERLQCQQENSEVPMFLTTRTKS